MQKRIMKLIPVLLIFILIIGTIPVSAAAKSKKPGKAKISTEVKNVTSDSATIVVKIGKTKNAEGYEVYKKSGSDKEYSKVKTIKESGDKARESSFTCKLSEKNVSIKVRAYNGSEYGKYSAVTKIKLSDYSCSSQTDKPGKGKEKTGKTDMTLTVELDRTDDNNIGNEWSYEYKVNGEKAKIGTGKYSFSAGDKITVYSMITEKDTKPDIGEAAKTYTVTEADLKNGFKISLDVMVTENAGRYVGRSANYKVTFKFKA